MKYNMNCIAIIKQSKIISSKDDLIIVTLPNLQELHSENENESQYDLDKSIGQNKDQKTNNYSVLYNYLHYTIAPFFDNSLQDSTDVNGSSHAYAATKKKLTELELSLVQLEQNTSIPEINIASDPKIHSLIQLKGPIPTPNDIGPFLQDSILLNKLQTTVNGWIKQVQKITLLTRDPASGTSRQEIEFWILLEEHLQKIEAQLKSPHVSLTLDILKKAKRFHATVSFIADTGIKDSLDRVSKYNLLMKDFPINELLSAPSLEKIGIAIGLIFTHFTKKLKVSPYPINRALPLAEAISKDLNNQIMVVLSRDGQVNPMNLAFEQFQEMVKAALLVFEIWEESVKEFISVCREMARKRSEKFIPIKVQGFHQALQERLEYIFNFRVQHRQLFITIQKVSGPQNFHTGQDDDGKGLFLSENALSQVTSAIESMKAVNGLDVSPHGIASWTAAEATYNEKIAEIENQIISRLRGRLSKCTTASQMFHVFSRFNALFIRPKIRGAIHEYQSKLIERVKDELKTLHQKFVARFNSGAFSGGDNRSQQDTVSVFSNARDLPHLSAYVVWVQGIEKQLAMLMKKVEYVLGKGWEQYAEGQALLKQSTAFCRNLDIKPTVQKWIQEELARPFVGGLVFKISTNRLAGNRLELGVNFDAKSISIFKEVRNLTWLGIQVPVTLQNIAKDSKRVYPFALSLDETLRIYQKTIGKLELAQHDNFGVDVGMLVAENHATVQILLSKATPLSWDYFINTYETRAISGSENRYIVFVRDLSVAVSSLQEKTELALKCTQEMKDMIAELSTMRYESQVFLDCMASTQKVVDRLDLEGVSNLKSWVAIVNAKIDAVLVARLDESVKEFASGSWFSRKQDVLVCRLKIQNQKLFLDPPVEAAHMSWISELDKWLAVVTDLRPIRVIGVDSSSAPTNYVPFLSKVDPSLLRSAYQKIEEMNTCVSKYVEKWLQYQSLWDTQLSSVSESLGDNLENWITALVDLKEERRTFDSTKNEIRFDGLLIQYGSVQAKVNSMYDQWQREITNQFALKLGENFMGFFNELRVNRGRLEVPISGSNQELVNFFILVQDLEANIPKWMEVMNLFQRGERLLETVQNSFSFSPDWLYYDHIFGEWSAFNEILARKRKLLESQNSALVERIEADNEFVCGRLDDLLAEWELSKPSGIDSTPAVALKGLQDFEDKFAMLHSEMEHMEKAKLAMGIDKPFTAHLSIAKDELIDLNEVWGALSVVWASVEKFKSVLWMSEDVWNVRKGLETLLEDMKKMPNKLRQYLAFQGIQERVQDYLAIHVKLLILKSEALRERHWNRIFPLLGIEGCRIKTLKVHDLWEVASFVKKEKQIEEVINLAQGEMALDEFLNHVESVWNGKSFEFVNFQNKCRLIKGWDDLFSKCQDHLTSLSAMKSSAHFKAFKDRALHLETSLSALFTLFEVWIDVQKHWIYLQGLFIGNMEIKQILPMETNRFISIDTEFMSTLRKIYKSPLVMDALSIPNIQNTMDRLLGLLRGMQKSLGEYLSRERKNYARFYFLSDDDLLDLLGNKDIFHIQIHLKKVFPAICSLILSPDHTLVLGVASKEGEQVLFETSVSVTGSRVSQLFLEIETEGKRSLASYLIKCTAELQHVVTRSSLLELLERYPGQVLILATQVVWTSKVEANMDGKKLQRLSTELDSMIDILSGIIVDDLDILLRKKCEAAITEIIHQRDVVRRIIAAGNFSLDSFEWLSQLRFYQHEKEVLVKISCSQFTYGFEYLGVQDRLVQTPLTDQCYLTLSQAVSAGLGGSPFGPAGTGKTESVKALAFQMGRHCLVFCCDESFDFKSMGRIFLGLCKVGAWGCFDEFNRLEENIISAVSQQIQSIQNGLKSSMEIDLDNETFLVNIDTAIFITMNPGYAGRSVLPNNLTPLFRPVAMNQPDRLMIAQVLLFSQGFRFAEVIASKIVPFFEICSEQLSFQQHYDFGLRALKSVLVAAGSIQRLRTNNPDLSDQARRDVEAAILIKSIRETLFPKLVKDDVLLAEGLMLNVFGEHLADQETDIGLREAVLAVCAEFHLSIDPSWIDKIIQIWLIQKINNGVMIVGQSGTGKSTAWKVLFKALEKLEGARGFHHIIEPKSMSKNMLYGWMDTTTREWSDGIFTRILRDIIQDERGFGSSRHWIVFDGDVDPEWIENMNSVLDDNKILTLPSGERLPLPSNVRILFEVSNLDQATPATVSRCGMVWFPDMLVTPTMIASRNISVMAEIPLDDISNFYIGNSAPSNKLDFASETQQRLTRILHTFFDSNGIVEKSLSKAVSLPHIMHFSPVQAIESFFSLTRSAMRKLLDYNSSHPDFPLAPDLGDNFFMKSIFVSLCWAFAGSMSFSNRQNFGKHLSSLCNLHLGLKDVSIFDVEPDMNGPDWQPWSKSVPSISLESSSVSHHDLIIPTVDTVRHESVLFSWISERRPLILCGPPGSGKTMTLLSSLRKMPDVDIVPINFSSETNFNLIIKTLELHCKYTKSCSRVTLSPKNDRWLILFCDEINLPKPDPYGTQRVNSFIRQLVESRGFWRSDRVWISIEKIQIVGACNPPTDPGRIALDPRFLRHLSVLFVDYPGEEALLTIYGTLSRAALKVHPELRGFSSSLAQAIVGLYAKVKITFTADQQAHYIYSPRELTRWIRGIHEILARADFVSISDLVTIWAHEAIRLFQDRLVTKTEKTELEDIIYKIASSHFPGVDLDTCLSYPILFSNFFSSNYEMVEKEALQQFVQDRLQLFYEEDLDKPLVLHDSALDHILRIDRVFRQTQGHALLIGISGSGKTYLTRFVSWMNGITFFQPSMHAKYSIEDFEEDLRVILRRSGCKSEKICFMMDESNIMDSSFLERMNTLLANAEVPGLFDGDEFTTLISACKEASLREGLNLDTHEDLYNWFTKQVAKNLHIVFSMNPPEGNMSGKTASSPALFNRCVLNWMGDWDIQAFYTVAKEYTTAVDLSEKPVTSLNNTYVSLLQSELEIPLTYRNVVLDMLLFVHSSCRDQINLVKMRQNLSIYITPRQFIDFISTFKSLYLEKRGQLEERQRHLIVGLDRLNETLVKVEELKKSLTKKQIELSEKSQEANEKLKQMVQDQQIAENKRLFSVKIQQQLGEKNIQITERKQIVEQELAHAEPAVLEAQESVSSIKKQHLTELRSMGNPPNAVKLTMESVCILLGHKVDESWKSVQAVLRRDDFISSVVNYDITNLKRSIRKGISEQYLADPLYTFEIANRASKACGPLLKWVVAQVEYANILEKVEPLRAKMIELESSAAETKAEAISVDEMISRLESSIAIYKEEYAVLITAVQTLKKEMETVEERVERSTHVLNNLESERIRWSESRSSFGAQMSTLVGDALLSAASLSYCGIFDQANRSLLLKKWRSRLEESKISFQAGLNVPDYLVIEDERRQWLAHGLPSDSLCVENAVMLDRADRYPFIIDPSGQALKFIASFYKLKNLAVTSFRDSSFLKTLESALRFGNPILIQDAEEIDCIINPVLNKEIKRSGGRNLVRLGSKDIDFSPNFKLFLLTKIPALHFTADVSSRVCFVNFTITHGSLFVQCLDKFLKAERPDIELKRKDLLKMQGEFQYRLHHLEKALLHSLNESTGNILDDTNVLSTLETLKKEATDISVKVAETDNILLEVEAVTSLYEPIAEHAASIFFCIEKLCGVRSFYQFSLEYFFILFEEALSQTSGIVGGHSTDRMTILENALFAKVFNGISLSLFREDLILFALLLANIKVGGNEDDHLKAIMSIFSVSGASIINSKKPVFNELVDARLTALSLSGPEFGKMVANMNANPDIWKVLISKNEGNPELMVEKLLKDSKVALESRFVILLIIYAFRPDRIFNSIYIYLSEIFGDSFINDATERNASTLGIDQNVSKPRPFIIISEKGHDFSHRIESMSQESSKKTISVALGSAEGVRAADIAISKAVRNESWLLVKNAHLDLAWLSSLEKRLSNIVDAKNGPTGFRLFITCESNANLPVTLLRQCRIVVFEQSTGIKSGLLQAYTSIPKSLQLSAPIEKTRIFFALSWLHAVIIERSKYIPMGWSKNYDFGYADFELSLRLVDLWTRKTSNGRANISPSNIPWHALQSLISRSVYGGKIDQATDQSIMDVLVQQFICKEIFNSDFAICDGVIVPAGTRYDQHVDWITKLDDVNETPGWLGLPLKSKLIITETSAKTLFGHFLTFNHQKIDTNPQTLDHRTSMLSLVSSLQALLPAEQVDISRKERESPLERFFYKEFRSCKAVIEMGRLDLIEVGKMVAGTIASTNSLRDMARDILHHRIPKRWASEGLMRKSFLGPGKDNFNLEIFLGNLKRQWEHVVGYTRAVDGKANSIPKVWLGGLFDPEAFLTATRQMASEELGISLDSLYISCHFVKPVSSETTKRSGFEVYGFFLQGAVWDSKLKLSNSVEYKSLTTSLYLVWSEREKPGFKSPALLSIPVFANRSRTRVLFHASLPVAKDSDVTRKELLTQCVSIFAT